MRLGKMIVTVLVLCGFVLLDGCTDDTEQPRTGTVTVLVIDEALDETVSDVSITISPLNLVSLTDENGLAVFKLPPGDYFVDAAVCCVGPGFINYHRPVKVWEGKTVDVRLQACLRCY